MTYDMQRDARTSAVSDGPSAENARDPARLVYLVAADRAEVLLPRLHEHFADEPRVAVLVERRTPNGARRPPDLAGHTHRRAPVAERDPERALPAELRHAAPHLRLVQPMEPVRRTHEDTDTADLVRESLALEPEAVSELWWRVSQRVLARLELRLGHLAADAAHHVLGYILDELPAFDPQQQRLNAWLDAVVDHHAQERSDGAVRAAPAVSAQQIR